MIYFATSYPEPIQRFTESLGGRLDGLLTHLSIDDMFAAEEAPIGHYIFGGLDQLSRYENDVLADFAAALRRRAPDARILNAPHRHIDRFALLRLLKAEGINDFDVWQIDCGERPDRYPVFIRPADGHGGSETELLADERAFDTALAYYEANAIPLRGRIAVGYAGERAADGTFHKYGVINIGGTLIPQHILRNTTWMVKRNERVVPDEVAQAELAFINSNPHADILARVFSLAGVDFGRVDYGLVGGRVQVYEINTNPHLPRFDKVDERGERRTLIADGMIAAFRAIDVPLAASGRVKFGYERAKRRLKMQELPVAKPLTADRLLRRLRRFIARGFRPRGR